MAHDTRGTPGTRRSRKEERREAVNRRVRGLRGDLHPYRFCPEESVSILVGPDGRCPACGKPTAG